MHLLKSKSGALPKDPRGFRNSQGCRSEESFCPRSFPPQSPAPRQLSAANSPSAKLPSSRREMLNLGASPPQPPPRRRAPVSLAHSPTGVRCAQAAPRPLQPWPQRPARPERRLCRNSIPTRSPRLPSRPGSPEKRGRGPPSREAWATWRAGRRGGQGAARKETRPPSGSLNFSQPG